MNKVSGRQITGLGVENLRDMGGIPVAGGSVRPGLLYRSGHFAGLTAAGAQSLAALNISTIIDFRSQPEKESMPAAFKPPFQPGVTEIPIGGNAAAWIKEMFARLKETEFPAKDLDDQFILAFQTIPIANRDGLRAFFDRVVEAASAGDGGLIFHCTAGKDRTGIAAALLLQALGADEEAVMQDFLATNQAVDLPSKSAIMAEQISYSLGRSIEPDDVLPLIGVRDGFLEAAWQAMADYAGSVEAYLTNHMEMTTERRDLLRSRYVG